MLNASALLLTLFVENGFLAREIEEVTQAYQTRMTAYGELAQFLKPQTGY